VGGGCAHVKRGREREGFAARGAGGSGTTGFASGAAVVARSCCSSGSCPCGHARCAYFAVAAPALLQERRLKKEAALKKKEENRKKSQVVQVLSSETAKRMMKSKKQRKLVKTGDA
jgi:hypothetical protein